MTRLVKQEVILHTGEFAGLQRQEVDRRDPGSGATARDRHESPELTTPLALLGGRAQSEPIRGCRQRVRVTLCQFAQRWNLIQDAKVAASILSGWQQNPGSEKRQLIERVLALPGEGPCPTRCRALGVTIEARYHLLRRCHQPVEAASRGRERGWPRTAGRRQILPKLREPGGSGSPCGVRENRCRVAKPLKQPRAHDRVIAECEQTRPQSHQIGREVPAVHGRDVCGRQWFQRERVVPVVEVAAVPLQGFHGAECIRRTLDQSSGRKITEVVGGQIGEERKPHVGRRRAMRHHTHGMLLIVIRRQPMVFWAHERLEERPRLSRQHPKKDGLISRQPRLAADERSADPPGDGGRGKPGGQYGPSDCQCGRPEEHQIDKHSQGSDGGDPHPLVGGNDVRGARAIGVARRIPLQESSAHDQPPDRAQDRIHSEEGLVGETCECKYRLSGVAAGRAHRGDEMLPQQHIARLPYQLQKRGHPRGNQDGADDRDGPEPERRNHRPAE